MLTTRKKANIIKSVQVHTADTGSPEVQIAILSRKIEDLTKHLKSNKKDNHSRRGLIQMVSDRRKHLQYLAKTDSKRHKEIAKKVGLKA
ncbi:MAG: small subunit ribosomal protein [Patescibacteria group bacterium]|nr:small subunit ribosomal protein [Patescibacteria group bacterium]